MIASTTFSFVFIFVIIFCNTTSADLTGTKMTILKPLYDSKLIVDNQNSVPKITITIYYESLCADCGKLFKNQIGPNLAKFQNYVNFDFVPYGNTEKKKFDERWFFKCRNGLDECMKNKWQACSIHVLPSKLQLLANYLVCYMNSTDKEYSGYQCTRKLGLNDGYYSKIKKCFMNKEFSDTLMLQYHNQTQNAIPPLSEMPAVVFNGVYTQNEQDDAKKDLRNLICKYLFPKPVGIC